MISKRTGVDSRSKAEASTRPHGRRKYLVPLVGFGVILVAVGAVVVAVLVATDSSQFATAYGLEGAEGEGTVWLRSCVENDQLAELRLLRDGALTWSYELAPGKEGLNLAEPVDIRAIQTASGYVATGQGTAWAVGDQLVALTTSGSYLSWPLGTQQIMNWDQLRTLPCVKLRSSS